jgi:hypothetical protein
MTMHVQTFYSIRRISKWLVNWSIATIIITMILLISNFYGFFQDLSSNDESYFEHNRGLIFAILSIFSVISLVTSILGFYWFYRANKNIHAFGAKQISSPIMAVIWWFVPIFQFWKPFSVVKQIWKASNPQVVISNGTEWKNTNSDISIVKIWWILAIISVSLLLVNVILSTGLIFDNSYPEPNETDIAAINEMITYKNIVVILSDILTIVSTIFFMRIIKHISTWQEIKAGLSV